METFTVEKFAGELGLPVNILLEQLKSADINLTNSNDVISEDDKAMLLNHLKNSHALSFVSLLSFTHIKCEVQQINSRIFTIQRIN